jgi:hypothetical protein
MGAGSDNRSDAHVSIVITNRVSHGERSMLLLRVVADLDCDSTGNLRPSPGAAWHVERARDEASLHRRLAALADAPATQIVAFASAHGLLRQPVPSPLDLPEPTSRALTTAIGQQDADNTVRLREWLESGGSGEPPPGTSETLLATALYASLPDWVLDTFDRFIADNDPSAVSGTAQDFLASFLPMAAAAGPATLLLMADPTIPAEIGRDRLLRALRLNEWAVRMFAGLDEPLPAVAALGGPDRLLQTIIDTLPEAVAVPELLDGPDGPGTDFIRSLTEETIENWRDAARLFRDQIRATRLVHSALGPHGLTPDQKADLFDLYSEAAGFRPQVQLSAAELAARLQPLLVARVEEDLLAARSWPIRRDAVAGLHVRALVALWVDLSHTAPPLACTTQACPGTVPPTRNRRFCDACQAARRRESVRRTRSRVTEID